MTDGELAAHLATEAGQILLGLRKWWDRDPRLLGEAGDAQANAFLVYALRDVRPADGLLSEEEKDDPRRLAQSRVWIVDPLDGTREYSEGRDDWAVHVALAVDGTATAGAVALPARGLTLCSEKPHVLAPANQPLKIVVSRTRPAAEALALAEKLEAELLPMGSAGAKAMAVVGGEADIYLHTGGQYEWDNCAPIAVAQAAGLHCSRVDGSPVRYNNPDPYLPDLLICRQELVPAIMAALSD